MAQERRKEHRLRANLPIKIVSQNGVEIIGRTENISRLGTYVEIDKEIPVGERVDLTVEIPGYDQDISFSGQVECKGSVFRSGLSRQFQKNRIYGIGIFFTFFNDREAKEKLSRYIDFLSSKEEQDIKEGLRRRKERERLKESEEMRFWQEEFQQESLKLLKEIIARLEEIRHLLKP
jgi:hypothetical protein